MVSVPEVDRAGFFDLKAARRKLKESQHPFLERLAAAVEPGRAGSPAR
jgi:predicted NUDIX family NTP pyrophosphohydrolase